MKAFCYRKGQIGFGRSVPDGALLLGSGPARTLREKVSGLARHAYDNITLLVPGVPEAPDDTAALKAVGVFCDGLSIRLKRR